MKKYILLILTFCFCLGSIAQNKKVALVIGNASYAKSPLRNPLNDADDVSAKLKALGFEVITAKDCKTKRDMRARLDAFCTKATNADAGVFYYSGHGIQSTMDGGNYLIPTEAAMTSEADVQEDCISLQYILNKMDDYGINMKVAIIDACRENPFRTWSRGGAKGLSTSINTPSGTFIAFATSANDVATNGAERNSPFTSAFLTALDGDNLEISNVFTEVKSIVKTKTDGGQRPWTSNDLSEHFYFGYQVISKTNLHDKPSNETNFHEYVDLGLPSGTLWSLCNIGASKPEDFGDYFSWGETRTKSEHSWETYKYCNGNAFCINKYTHTPTDKMEIEMMQNIDNLTTLENTDDAASVLWGSAWHIPTGEELVELIENCYSEWHVQNGINGYLFTSKKNKNTVFFPAAGWKRWSKIDDLGKAVYYWTSSLARDFHGAAALNFTIEELNCPATYRNTGLAIRPVRLRSK